MRPFSGRPARRIVVVALLGALAAGAAPKPLPDPGAPDANGWSLHELRNSCALAGPAPIIIATIDGNDLAVAYTGAVPGAKPIDIDGYTYSLSFRPTGSLMTAPLSPNTQAALAQARMVSAEWPDATFRAPPPTVASLVLLRQCGRKVDQAAKQEAQKTASRRAFWRGVGAVALGIPAAAASASRNASSAQSGVDREGGPRLGALCFKSSEAASGFYKTCVYSCGAAGAVTETVGSAELCPLSTTH